MRSTALRYDSYGEAENVIHLDEVELPPLLPGEALIKILAAPINPADFGRIGGSYGELAKPPATAGLEGVAEVIEIGQPDTSDLQVGQRVFVPSAAGSWQTHAVVPSKDLFHAPENMAVEQAAMAWINPPTAWKLIHDFSTLKPGDWIAQNAANSAVGKLVIQFAHHLGLKTFNLVRSIEAADSLKELGANIVELDDREAARRVLERTNGQKARLGLNSVGGSSALSLCKLLQDQCDLVTFGGMDRDPAPFPTRYLIFNDIRLRGFWIKRWYADSSREDIRALHQDLFTFMENAGITTEIAATFTLANWRDALACSLKPGKSGKAVFTFD